MSILAKKIKKILKHPRKAQKFINLNLELIRGLCPDCKKIVERYNGLKDFSKLCPSCRAYAKQFEDEFNKLLE